ncbi:hypothetical protein AB0L99_35290 [Streptomyces sp. NPDC051954]|uniref:hypothetical protein n=1 Tax=unclassified Streptomyces TaxID=2593676 RepID=UPI00342EB4ED
MDPPEHTRFRMLFTGEFTVRRAVDRIAAMRDMGPSSDLVREFALPISSSAICEPPGPVRSSGEPRRNRTYSTSATACTSAWQQFARVEMGVAFSHRRRGWDMHAALIGQIL